MDIQFKRGQQEGVKKLVLKDGEPAVALDTGNLYIGTPSGNVQINNSGGTVDTANKLKNPQKFSITGDVTAPEVSFDGTTAVVLNTTLPNLPGVGGEYTKVQVNNKGQVTGGGKLGFSDLPPITADQVGAIPMTQKGTADGVASLDSSGKVPASQLPGFVDDVQEYDNRAAFPPTGESSIIYIAKDKNKTYRWGGSDYVPIGSDLALGETSSTAYPGDRGKAAYDHSQVRTGNPHGTTATDVGAAPAAHMEMKASGTQLGHIKPGTGMEVDGNGALQLIAIDDGTF